MNSGRVAIRYAKGLLKYGNIYGIADKLYANTPQILKLISESNDLSNLMENPSIRPNLKVEALKQVLIPTIDHDIVEFLCLMIKKNRFEYAFNSLLLFQTLYRKENNILDVQIETAVDLEKKELEEIKNFVHTKFDKKIELTVKTSSELVAGFILIVEGKMVDLSVKGQLAQYKKSLGLNIS